MKWALVVIILMPFWIYLAASTHDEALQTKLKAELKEGLKLATHDAALQLDQEQLEGGVVVFLEDQAEVHFLKSIIVVRPIITWIYSTVHRSLRSLKSNIQNFTE